MPDHSPTNILLGLDFGGTKLAAGLVDPTSGRVIASDRKPTPARGGSAASIAAMLAMVRILLTTPQPQNSKLKPQNPGLSRVEGSKLIGVGVSFGGPVEADGRTVRLSMHVPGWENTALADRIEREFGVPAAVANDGDAAALAEHRFGAGRGVRHMLYMTVSTGIGGGIIIDGRLHRGERAWAGEV